MVDADAMRGIAAAMIEQAIEDIVYLEREVGGRDAAKAIIHACTRALDTIPGTGRENGRGSHYNRRDRMEKIISWAKSAREWMAGGDDDNPLNFNSCCNIIGIEPHFIKGYLEKRIRYGREAKVPDMRCKEVASRGEVVPTVRKENRPAKAVPSERFVFSRNAPAFSKRYEEVR